MLINRRDFLRTTGGASLALSLGGRARLPVPAQSLQFWDMDRGGAVYQAAANKLIALYNASNPASKVTYQSIEWSSWPEVFFLAVEGGQAPDLSTGGGYQAVQYYSRNEIVPVDDMVAELTTTGDRADFLPGSLERMVYDGHSVGLPWATDIRPFYYRKDLFAKAGLKEPTSWDEMESAATALSQGGQCGFVFAGGYLHAMHFVLTLMLNNGGGLFTPDGKLDLLNARNVEALKFFSGLVAKGLFHPATATLTPDGAQEAFIGTGGSILYGGLDIQHKYPDQVDKIGVMPPPAGPHGDKGTISWVQNLMLYRGGHDPNGAKAFLKWWSSNQKPLWTEGHCQLLPVRASFANDPYFQNDPIARRMIDEWTPVGKSAGSQVPGIFPALNELEGYGPMTTLCTDILKGKDVTPSMAVANARMKAVLASYGVKSV